jgi:class 3 adenylate cyclase
VRYDIFGSDVAIANKMESGGKPGRINVSEDTRNILEFDDNGKKIPLDYVFEDNKIITHASVNREIMSYLIKYD